MIGFRLWQIAGWTMLHYFWVGAALGAAAARDAAQAAVGLGRRALLAALGSLLLLSLAPVAVAVVVTHNVPARGARSNRRPWPPPSSRV